MVRRFPFSGIPRGWYVAATSDELARRSVVARRTVFYAPAAEPTEAERREAARLLLRLRDRTEALEKTKVQP